MAIVINCKRILQCFERGVYFYRNGLGKSVQMCTDSSAITKRQMSGLHRNTDSLHQKLYQATDVPMSHTWNKCPGQSCRNIGYVVPHQQIDAGKQAYSKVDSNDEKQSVAVEWTDGQVQDYPHVWLRDNCQCEECFHPSSFSRSFSFPQLDVTTRPSRLRLFHDHRGIELEWDDGHCSSYDATWLYQYRFDKSPPDMTFDSEPVHWDSNLGTLLKEYSLGDILASDECLYDWIMQMKVLGVTLVKARAREGEILRLAERIAFIRTTCYGETVPIKTRDVSSDNTNLAYTNKSFPIHSDLVCYGRPPGILLLHCIKPAEGHGGENMVVDGFKIAKELKVEDPEAFEILTETEVEFFDLGKEVYGKYHQRSRHPTISLDSRGRLNRINISDHARDAMLRIPNNQVRPFYDALSSFSRRIYSEENIYPIKLAKGDILAMGNNRVLHGRRPFEATSSRYLDQGYLEWDEMNSRLRILHTQLGYQ